MTPSFRFPLPAGGTVRLHGCVPPAGRGNQSLRGSPREAGGTLRRGANKTLPARLVKLNNMEERL
jgi:hypothetical protein